MYHCQTSCQLSDSMHTCEHYCYTNSGSPGRPGKWFNGCFILSLSCYIITSYAPTVVATAAVNIAKYMSHTIIVVNLSRMYLVYTTYLVQTHVVMCYISLHKCTVVAGTSYIHWMPPIPSTHPRSYNLHSYHARAHPYHPSRPACP